MDWMTISGNIPCVALISLGAQYKDKYYVSDDCPQFLNEILEKLNDEEPTRDFRRALSFMDIINKDLIPILVNVKDQPAIFRSTIKVLVGLTAPVECLLSTDSEVSPQVVHEVTQLIFNAKEAFLEPRATRAILDHLFPLVDKQPLSTEDCEAVNDCLLLLRNILHAPERPAAFTNSFKEKCTHPHLPSSVGVSTAATEKEKGPSVFTSHGHGHASQQNRLLWNLFSQGLDKLMINLLSSEQKGEWVVSVVQLIALFYKDQHVEAMQKLIGSLIDSTSSDSSEDDESNTSPPGPDGRASPQILTTSSSDPTSDSSDSAVNSGGTNHVPSSGECTDAEFKGSKSTKMMVKAAAIAAKFGDTASVTTVTSSLSDDVKSVATSTSSGVSSDAYQGSMLSDPGADKAPELKDKPKECTNKRKSSCLKGSHTRQAKNDVTCASNSTSSEDLRLCTKRPLLGSGKLRASNAERDKRRKSVIKRSCSVTRKKKTFGHHIPTEEDISQLLKDFTIDFLLKGYDSLVDQLHQLLLEKNSLPLDKSHFLWLVTYFLRFASQLELDIKHVKSVLSTNTLCFLTWQALMEAELLEVDRLNESADLKPNLRRLHLAVTAIREFLQAVETYSRVSQLNEVDRQQLLDLRSSLLTMRDLRQLFLLLIRHFNPLIQSPRYLRDVITTNHMLLLSLERSGTCPESRQGFVLQDHMQQFCSRTVLKQYGLALEDYKTNGQFVNDCILTVLHHIGTDLGNADLLCEPVILRSFSRICEEEFEMCDDWVDLIEFVCQRFLRNFHQDSSDYESDYKPKMTEDSSGSDNDMEAPDQQQQQENRSPDMNEEPVVQDIKRLTGRLMESGMQQQLLWLQQQLLTICSVKLQAKQEPIPAEIVASMSQRVQVSCPLVPWSDVQAAALRTEAFVLLLHRLGLTAETAAGIFPRVPFEWDCDTLYSVALELGPVSEEMVTFDLGLVKQVQLPDPCDSDGLQAGVAPQWIPPYLGPGPGTSLSVMPHHWLHWVEQSGSLFRSAEKTSNGHSVSLSISNHSHRPMDSISTTSSLEVHKTDSSDDEEMEDRAPQSVEPVDDFAVHMEQDSVT